MVKSIRSGFAGAVACACLVSVRAHPAAAAGDPRPPLSDFISLSNLNEWAARIGLVFVRSAVGLTYQEITNDPYANRTSVSGVVIQPPLPWDKGRNCLIHAERLSIASSELGDWDRIRLQAELTGALVPLACLPPEVAGTAAIAEIPELVIDRLFLTVDYRLNSSALRADVHLTMPDLAAVTANADVAYFAVQEDGPEPVIMDISHVSLAVENLGLWEKAKKMMPPEMTKPDSAAGIVQGGLTEMLGSLNPPGQPGVPLALTPAQAEFVAAAATQARAFAANGGAVVVETQLDRPVRFSERMADDPAQLFAVLNPRVGSRLAAHDQVLGAALLTAGLNNPASLSDEDKLRVGQALVSGNGAPRSPADGEALLKPLADNGNSAAALALAESLRSSDAEAAYGYALLAGVNGADGAPGVMDRLEQDLTTPRVLTIQADELIAVGAMASPHDFVPLADVRSRALAHLRGRSAVRSYARAYYWALLGKAAGDQAAASLADEIETRMRHRGEEAAMAWDAAAEQARAEALVHWLTADYPAKLAEQ